MSTVDYNKLSGQRLGSSMEDFLLIDQFLSEDERLIRDAVGRFVDDEVVDLMLEANEKAEFPRELIPKIAQLGILGMKLPSKYGGSETSAVAYGLVCQELERGDSAIRSFVSVQSSLCMYPIYQLGSEGQREKWLLPMSKGEVIGCFGLTEAGSGSDPGSMKTRAEPVGDGWILNGSKMWITNAPFADIAIVWAKTAGGIRGFIVETNWPGVEVIKTQHKFSLRASATGELIFTDVKLSKDSLLPGTEKGLGSALSCLNQARFGIAWGAIGAAMSCYQTALDYTSERKQFGKSLSSNQLIQKSLADMLTEICKAQTLNLHIGRLFDQDKITPEMISMAKMNAAREALKIARTARNLLGASGISLEYPIIRHMVNLESVFTYEGTDNVHHLILGKHITGINAF